MKKIISIIFVITFILSNFNMKVNAAGAWPTGPEIESPTALVMDVDTGTILYQKDELTAYEPASITKIMTALVALENSSLDEMVVFSETAIYGIEIGSSSIGRDFYEEMTMEQCLYGLMLESANECANAIAEHVGGDIKGFVEMMNKKAAQLGCKNTHFANPHGLHDNDHYTCSYDMALIARAGYQNPTLAMIMGSKRYTIPPTNKHEESTPLNNHHAMLNYYRTNEFIYDKCVGGKTGYTEQAHNTLVTYAKYNDVTLVCVIMGAATSMHYRETRRLFDYYFDKVETYSAKDYIVSMSSNNDNLTRLVNNIDPIQIDEEGKFILPKGVNVNVIESEFLPGTREGTGIGQIVFYYQGFEVGSAKILGNVEDRNTYPFHNLSGEQQNSMLSYVRVNPIKILVIVVSVIICAVLLFFIIKKSGEISLKLQRIRHEKEANRIDLPRIKRTNNRRKRW